MFTLNEYATAIELPVADVSVAVVPSGGLRPMFVYRDGVRTDDRVVDAVGRPLYRVRGQAELDGTRLEELTVEVPVAQLPDLPLGGVLYLTGVSSLTIAAPPRDGFGLRFTVRADGVTEDAPVGLPDWGGSRSE